MEVQAIRGDTKLVALLGYPVAHSLSPAIHNHAFARLGLPFVYIPLAVPPQAVHTTVHALRACGFAGANVTIPHKSAVVPYCDTISELSARTGTVNTLYLREGRLCGTTTDPEGFYRSLARMGRSVEDAGVVILGNGGTARTLGFAIAMDGKARSIAFMGRSAERVRPVVEEIRSSTGHEIEWCLYDDPRRGDLLKECTLLVNCTSAGMHPHTDVSPLPAEAFHKNMAVLDAVYNPAETLLLRHARSAGCATSNGLPMLLYQGLASFSYWTGVQVGDDLFDLDELQAMVGA
jgi:shikimate dehydrogenase